MSVSRAHSSKATVCLVQPHPLAVRSFSQRLSARCRVLVISDCRAVPKLCNPAASVFIFDKATTTMPMPVSLEALRHAYSDPKAILLAPTSTPEEQFQLLSLGLKGIILYKDVSNQLRQAVLSVISGGYWVGADVVAQYVHRRPAKLGQGNCNRLSDREADVLQLLKRRFSNKEIGLKLLLSESTVKFHVSNIFSKLGVHDRQSVLDILEIRNDDQDKPTLPAKPCLAAITMGQSRSVRAS